MWIRSTCPHRSACPPFKLPGKQQATIHSLKQAMIEQLATSIRTKKTRLDRRLGIQKTSAECARRHNKNINIEPPTLDAQKFTENCCNKNECLKTKPNSWWFLAISPIWCTGGRIFSLGQATESAWVRPWYYNYTSCRTQDWYSCASCVSDSWFASLTLVIKVPKNANHFQRFSYSSSGFHLRRF